MAKKAHYSLIYKKRDTPFPEYAGKGAGAAPNVTRYNKVCRQRGEQQKAKSFRGFIAGADQRVNATNIEQGEAQHLKTLILLFIVFFHDFQVLGRLRRRILPYDFDC